MAKNVTLVSLKCLNAQGTGATSAVLAALNYALATIIVPNASVINLSISGGYSQVLNDAVNKVFCFISMTTKLGCGRWCSSGCSRREFGKK